MPSPSEDIVPRCLLCAMNCAVGARLDAVSRVGTVYPSDLGAEPGACVRGLTAARLMTAPERVFEGAKAGQAMAAGRLLEDMAADLARYDADRTAFLVDVSRPLEGVLAAAALSQQMGAGFGAFAPPEDAPLVRAGMASCPSFAGIADCDVLLGVGDPFSTHPAVATFVRDAQFGGRGHKLVSVDTAWSRTGREADQALIVSPLKLAGFMAALAVRCGAGAVAEALGGADARGICESLGLSVEEVEALADALQGAQSPAIIIANPRGRYAAPAAVAAAARELAAALKASAWPLPVSTNSAALPALRAGLGAMDLGEVLARVESGRVKALVVLGLDPQNALPGQVARALREGCELLCWAGAMQTPFAGTADYALPLALAWEEEGTVLDPSGRPAPCKAWLPKPDAVASMAEFAAALAEKCGAGPLEPADPKDVVGREQAPAALDELIGTDLLRAREPSDGAAVLIGRPEPQGYTGGVSLAEASWQRRLSSEEAAAVSPELAEALGLADTDLVELGDGHQATVRCRPDERGSGRVVAVPTHWAALTDLLQWRGPDGKIEPEPALVNVSRPQ